MRRPAAVAIGHRESKIRKKSGRGPIVQATRGVVSILFSYAVRNKTAKPIVGEIVENIFRESSSTSKERSRIGSTNRATSDNNSSESTRQNINSSLSDTDSSQRTLNATSHNINSTSQGRTGSDIESERSNTPTEELEIYPW